MVFYFPYFPIFLSLSSLFMILNQSITPAAQSTWRFLKINLRRDKFPFNDPKTCSEKVRPMKGILIFNLHAN